jgi:hypothetical protein
MINTSISGIPMEMALQLMSRYIYEKKGVIIHPKAPITPREIELFEQMIGPVLDYYKINI